MSEVTEERAAPKAAPKAESRSWKQGGLSKKIWRIGSAVLLMVLGGAIALGAERLLGGGSANETRVSTFTDWRVVCPPYSATTPNCALTLDVMRDTGGVLLTLSMLDPAMGSPLSITVPHGVLLDAGLGFNIGAEPVRVRPYETCTNQGCIALVTVDADTLKSLSGNMNGQIVVALPGNPQPVTVPFSLRGFPEGYAQLQRVKSQRASVLRYIGL